MRLRRAETFAAKQWHHLVITYDGSGRAAGLRPPSSTVSPRPSTSPAGHARRFHRSMPSRFASAGGTRGSVTGRPARRAADPGSRHPSGSGRGLDSLDRLRGILQKEAAKRSPPERDILLDDFIDRQAESAVRVGAGRRPDRPGRREARLEGAISVRARHGRDDPRRGRRTSWNEGSTTNAESRCSRTSRRRASSWPEGLRAIDSDWRSGLSPRTIHSTARVAVNRLWRQCFGEGLVRTVNDFGTQGDLPTHPELLDHLAARFRDGGWDVKGCSGFIVTSQTYRQQSNAVLQEERSSIREPLADAGARFRLPMEMIRDQAARRLRAAGPTSGRAEREAVSAPGVVGGGLVATATKVISPIRGEGLWRRSLYTYVKRQALRRRCCCSDGPTREKCTVRPAADQHPAPGPAAPQRRDLCRGGSAPGGPLLRRRRGFGRGTPGAPSSAASCRGPRGLRRRPCSPGC